MRFSLKQLFIAIALLAAALALVRLLTHVEFGEQVESVSWLPKSATNVSYYKSYRFTAYEFDIPETEFLEWAEQWPVKPVTKRSTIRRYTRKSLTSFRDPPNLTAAESLALWESRKNSEAIISNGYHYSYRGSNGGGVAVGYDRDNGRAYFQSNPR